MSNLITFFYNGLLISKYYTNNPDNYTNIGDNLIISSLKKNISIKNQIPRYNLFCKMFYDRRLNKKKVSKMDHTYFITCFMALMKLNIIKEDNNNGIVILKNKNISI